MQPLLLNIDNHLTAIGFILVPVQVLGHQPKLDDQVAGSEIAQ
jgi:hypothetical protein